MSHTGHVGMWTGLTCHPPPVIPRSVVVAAWHRQVVREPDTDSHGPDDHSGTESRCSARGDGADQRPEMCPSRYGCIARGAQRAGRAVYEAGAGGPGGPAGAPQLRADRPRPRRHRSEGPDAAEQPSQRPGGVRWHTGNSALPQESTKAVGTDEIRGLPRSSPAALNPAPMLDQSTPDVTDMCATTTIELDTCR